MDTPRWSKLTHKCPQNSSKHVIIIKRDFKAVRRYLTQSGGQAVPKHLFMLLHVSHVELSKNLLARSGREHFLNGKPLEPTTGLIEQAMRRVATETVNRNLATLEEQFTTIDRYVGATRAKGVPSAKLTAMT